MKTIDMSEYDPKKEYPVDTKFVLDDTPHEITIPQFLQNNKELAGFSNKKEAR